MTTRRVDILNKCIVFLLGAAFGAVASALYFKTKYERIANEEIESVKKVYSKKETVDNQMDTVELMEELSDRLKRENTEEYHDLIQRCGYSYNEEKGGPDMKKPYIIPPEEFDQNPDYEKITLTMYSDGVLTDEYDEVIEDVDDTVGEDSLNHFGEYEDDCVYVRDERTDRDYEILRDNRPYSEVCSSDDD